MACFTMGGSVLLILATAIELLIRMIIVTICRLFFGH